jgi:muconate cycloisomerase
VSRLATAGPPGGRLRNAAACAVELAIFDAMLIRDSHLFSHGPATAKTGAEIGDCPGFSRSGRDAPRVTGVLGSKDPARTAHRLRMMRWYGLRDFKLKLGFPGEIDAENLRLVHRQLRRGLRAGSSTLRVDVNSAWPAASVPDRVARLAEFGVCVVEQPADVRPDEMVALARKCALPLMADESLLTARDAAVLVVEPRVWWSIRISKNGGIAPALELCLLAADRGVTFTLGCLVGESGILSAAQRRLMELAPRSRFIEGSYGRFLLSDDLTTPSPRFGYGGRLRRLPGPGLGVRVDEKKLQRYGRLVKTLTA